MSEKLLAWLLQYWMPITKGGLGLLGALAERNFSQLRPLKSLPQPTASSSRILGNLALFVVWTLTSVATATALISIAKLWVPGGFGIFKSLSLPTWLEILLTFLVLDFAQYTIHRLEHAIPILWRLHSVHHSDQLVDMSTSLRKHPLAAVFSSFCMLGTVILFGISAQGWITYNVIGEVFGFLSHSNYQFPHSVDFFLERLLLISPQNHRVHHSPRQAETDSNFGVVLSLWDRLFLSYCRHPAPSEYGLHEVPPEHQYFPATFYAPFLLKARHKDIS